MNREQARRIVERMADDLEGIVSSLRAHDEPIEADAYDRDAAALRYFLSAEAERDKLRELLVTQRQFMAWISGSRKPDKDTRALAEEYYHKLDAALSQPEQRT
jgi:hypothetical protein